MPLVLPGRTVTQPILSFMPNDGLTIGVGSPLWWVYRLSNRLQRETVGHAVQCGDGVLVWKVGTAKLKRYYNGDFDLPWVQDADLREQYRLLIERARSNFMRLVVDCAAERVDVQGLRLPGDDEVADSETWDIWTRNDMDRWFPTGVQTALAERVAYWSVWWDQNEKGRARISLEDPEQMIVEYEPGDRNRVAAALKLWIDEWTGAQFVNLLLPNSIHRLRWGTPPGGGPTGWYPRQDVEKNPLGYVPVFPMANDPDLYGNGVSRIEDVMPAQDRINQSLVNMQVAEHLSAFMQKWATGLEIPEDPETGLPVQPFRAAIDSLWIAPGGESSGGQAKFGQFEATKLENYIGAIEMNLEQISVLTRTPRHVFVQQGQAPSGDAMKSDEAGLVADVKGMWRPFGSSIKGVLRAARQIEGLSTPLQSEIVWADPEFQTLGQLVDAQVKLVQARLASRKYAQEKIGMTPATIKRVNAEMMEDDLLAASLQPEQPQVVDDGAAAGTPPAR